MDSDGYVKSVYFLFLLLVVVFLLPLGNDHTESPRGKEFSIPNGFSLSPLVKESEREFRALRRSQFTMFLFDLSLSLFPTSLPRFAFVFRRTHRNFLCFLSLSWGKYPYTKQASASVQEQRRLFSADAVQSTDESSWDTAIAQGATEETKRELASLAKTMADIKDAVQRDADRSTNVDFAKFKQQLTNSPEIVDLFQKAYTTLKLPKYESTEVEDVTKAFKVLEDEAKKQAAESAKRIEELEKELVLLKEERESLERVSMDEIFEREPEMREKFNEQIKKDEWF